ncbi:hypothetical protein DTO166G4_7471 [Paecilomyces variotii]|nr:hypothetical protein DTO032I3_1653 [Paecilomyces variotii]KAJ9210974.1 hypothetical protein DTO166G4_7471 [Paecilomyces variotii]KAJ9242377.1 hypothetical protein DTO166G5_780 [Paecilomyces variotii]KAJ9278197.1 hypothetical protein DTO021D3_4931 [Paecilomyces variotii]KAJ9345561.1 hypothetical protein DTO027B6_2092 [Paecilomyces variotii]
MRPPRLILLLLSFIFLPILLTCLSLLSAHPRHDTADSSLAGRTSRLRALFSFNAPSSLFPPSAIISLTDDNSTFFLARPAAFGPLLPAKGLSGQLWIGSGFGEDSLRKGGATARAEGELGCSDVPGWGEGDQQHLPDLSVNKNSDKDTARKPADGPENVITGRSIHRRGDALSNAELAKDSSGAGTVPSADDGTDDHLHHPLPGSESPDPSSPDNGGDHAGKNTHADIQSLQESAEIAGKVVLLSRGGCGFLEKVKWVQRRGGVALIVGDDTRGGNLVTMYAHGDTSNVTIPAVFTSHTTAHLLSSLIPPQTVDDSGTGRKPMKLPESKGKGSEQGSRSTKTSGPVSTPTSTARSKSLATVSSSSGSESGFLGAILSVLGLGSSRSYSWHLPEDSRRPPSSGNIDWVIVDHWEEEETSSDAKAPADKTNQKNDNDAQSSGSKQSASEPSKFDGDGFVIGVQDWRDPDLVAPQGSPAPKSNISPGQSGSKAQDGQDMKGKSSSNAGSNGPKGGSIMPGSGEYVDPEKSSKNSKSGKGSAKNQDPAANSKSDTMDSHGPSNDGKASKSTGFRNQPVRSKADKPEEHEGLWVTLTPTTMSTSPFFDTLLVLVVSPLITLTVVYALLLLRSRIRRRRWRAPKSVVDRLPVRTYHTISPYSSACNTPRPPSPGSSSPTSPLLSSESHPTPSRSRPRSQTASGVVLSTSESAKDARTAGEKSSSGSTLWRRKYTGRQVECVVCLEEYVDGQSRVMSLPCGHEFHVECITPWLTTRRRTCPICKGDVVRSMSQYNNIPEQRERNEQTADDIQTRALEARNDSPSAAVPISGLMEDEASDLERGDDSSVPLLDEHAYSAPQSNWRQFASLSLSALSGDTIWHQARADRSS